MTPTEFEKHVQVLVAKRLKKEFNKDIPVYHQKVYTSLSGGSYSIDVSYTLKLLGIEYLTLVECKYWNKNVTRDRVGYLITILEAVQAHKGVIVTTVGFQSGAIELAKAKGIGLIRLLGNDKFEVHSNADGALDELIEILTHEEAPGIIDITFSVGLFSPVNSVVDFISKSYGQELAAYLENEFSPDMLDDDISLAPKVKDQLQFIPLTWTKEYTVRETAGLNYTLSNEPELRFWDMVLLMIKPVN